MARYLIEAKYTQEGLKGFRSEGASGRRTAVEALCRSLGGTLESFYVAFGETDIYAIVDLPDNVSAAAASLTIASSGAVTLRTTVLLTTEEADAAARKQADYRPPGG